MAFKLGYYGTMRWVALSSLAYAGCLMASSLPMQAQTVNWGPSVTSLNFGGSGRPGGVPPSVTSLGFGRMGAPGWSDHSHLRPPMFPVTPLGNLHHHRPIYPIWGGYYPYPVFLDSENTYQDNTYQNVPDSADNSDEYRGGPTIFDRRGDGQYASHRSELVPESLEAKSLPPSQPVAEVANQPQTVLVFKDGHQASVDNYAIVGNTLYDLTGGKRHKIALADLDLKATVQRNDDRGVDFELPETSALN